MSFIRIAHKFQTAALRFCIFFFFDNCYADSIWLPTVAFVLFSKAAPAMPVFGDRWLALRTAKECSRTKDVILNTSVCLILSTLYVNDSVF